MSYEHLVEYATVGALGAAAGECLKLYELRGKLTSKKFRRLQTLPTFWLVVVGMVAASGLIAWAANANVADASPLQLMLGGLGARGFVRGFAESRVANRPLAAGGDPEDGPGHLSEAFS